ncbi:methylated-DNA--protein-cysteine methyltransferase [Afipia sp. P52-10]|uniref:methylated-DNA--[protein]-cysteine S-methyltransferase n=1 Tax=Afipia sp. P52-10 TaxID=1429916 RepID=UPI0003DEFECA|nr:methylated-DNA--[protein]-cysteine S-methyltransferase [Afipia sp. P52-10]ETR77063.1 methylated-DNA--protein-cysteine methyltransferase [Afipia sp. P52-10]
MTSSGFALFDTELGRCGVAWNAHGLTGVQLPQPNEAQTRTRLFQRSGGELPEAAPSPAVAHAIEGMTALLAGEKVALDDIALDMSLVPDFNRGVYQIARTIPPGSTLTYGDIAKQLGGVELSRDVGQALGQNPFPIVVPCHRVLAAGGKPGGFSANGGVKTKLKMLAIEGAYVNHTPSLFD